MGDALVLGLSQGVVRVWGLLGEHRDHLVEVAVGRRSGDAVVAGRRRRIDVLAEPARAQHRLPEAGQRPGVRAGAASAQSQSVPARDSAVGAIGDAPIEPAVRPDRMVGSTDTARPSAGGAAPSGNTRYGSIGGGRTSSDVGSAIGASANTSVGTGGRETGTGSRRADETSGPRSTPQQDTQTGRGPQRGRARAGDTQPEPRGVSDRTPSDAHEPRSGRLTDQRPADAPAPADRADTQVPSDRSETRDRPEPETPSEQHAEATAEDQSPGTDHGGPVHLNDPGTVGKAPGVERVDLVEAVRGGGRFRGFLRARAFSPRSPLRSRQRLTRSSRTYARRTPTRFSTIPSSWPSAGRSRRARHGKATGSRAST
jgi:hypothetical protein